MKRQEKNLNAGINSTLRKVDNNADPIPISELSNASQAWRCTSVILAVRNGAGGSVVQGHPQLRDESEASLCCETLTQTKRKIIKINDQMWMGRVCDSWNTLAGSDAIINSKVTYQ